MKALNNWSGAVAVLALCLAACGGTQSGGGGPSAKLAGKVHGGQQPVSGAQVTAYAAGAGTGGAQATALACVQTDASGNFTFGAASPLACGGSSLPTAFSCPSTTCPSAASLIYLVARGGNPGLSQGTNNGAIVLMAAVGPYYSSGVAGVEITELTTVASAYALAPMIGAVASGGLAGRLAQDAAVSGKSPGLDHSFTRARSLVDIGNSGPGTALPAAANCASEQTATANCQAEWRLNTLADALASCVNSGQGSSSACQALFCNATPNASFSGSACTPPEGGAVPADTLQAALAVALNPGLVPAAGIFSLAGSAPPFQPVLARVPNDWALALSIPMPYVSAGQTYNAQPQRLSFDAAGNLWLTSANGGVLLKLRNDGTALSPAAGFPVPGLGGNVASIGVDGDFWVSQTVAGSNGGKSFLVKLGQDGEVLSPAAGYPADFSGLISDIAIDSQGNVWAANASAGSTGATNNVIKLNGSDGTTLLQAGNGGLSSPTQVAVGKDDTIWLLNGNGDSVSELGQDGKVLSPQGGYLSGKLGNRSNGMAVDPSGNVWIPELLSNGIVELSNAGVTLSPDGGYTVATQFEAPFRVAADSAGNIWVANTSSSLSELDKNGTRLSAAQGFFPPDGTLTGYSDLAIDSSGDVWVSNNDYSVLIEYVGIASPVKTPLIGPATAP